MTAPTIGFVGLGNMGLPMSNRLLLAGHTVVGFDLSPDARTAFSTNGGVVAEGLAQAAACDVVILMLPNSAIVAEVLGDEEVLGSLHSGSILIDMSSSEPLATRALAASLGTKGVTLIDAPVSGGVKGAIGGTLTVMVGGDKDDVARVQPILEHFGRVVHAGGSGAGHAIKALNNLLSATHLWVTSEAIETGKRFGLDPQVMLDIFNSSSGRSGSTENKWPNFVLPGTYDSGFGLRLMLKDMRIATTLAEQVGATSQLGDAAVERWTEAAEDLPPTADHTEVAAWIAKGGTRNSTAS